MRRGRKQPYSKFKSLSIESYLVTDLYSFWRLAGIRALDEVNMAKKKGFIGKLLDKLDKKLEKKAKKKCCCGEGSKK